MPIGTLVERMMIMPVLVMIRNVDRIYINRVQTDLNRETVIAMRMVEVEIGIDLQEVSQDKYEGKSEPDAVSNFCR